MSFSASARRGLVWFLCVGLAGSLCTSAAAQDESAVLQQAQQAVEQGHFRAADALLAPHLGDPNAPVVNEFAVLREIMRRIRQDYALTPEKMLAKLRESIPDVAREDVDRWRADGTLQHRVIDDETWYFGREPGNLFRFGEQAKARRTPPVKAAGDFVLPAHVARLLEAAKESAQPQVDPVKQRIRYEIRVHDGNPRLHPGAKVRCWLPFPQEYRQQRDVRLISTDPPGGTIAPNGCPQRTIYFEQTLGDEAKPPHFAVEFEFVCSAYVPDLDPNAVRPYDLKSPLYVDNTAERAPHIVFTPEMRATVKEIVGDEQNPLLKARRIFRWLSQNVKYCAEMEYSTIPNISAKALSSRRGDCGVQSLLFITLCRAAGVPARWQSGWETLPGGWNMHDWAEFYVEPSGWLPADPSYGLQEHADPRVQDFYCGRMDAYRMIVNLDYGRPLDPPKISFRSEPTDFQRGEIEIDGHNLYFDEWDWTFDFRAIPTEGGLAALADSFDALVPELLKKEHIPGAVIAVGKKTDDGFRTWQKAYGFLQTEPQRATMPEDAVFDLASMTKPTATGTSLMILVERGKVRLDDPVGKYLPEFREGDKAAVTVRHLMTHTSGMPPYVDAPQQKALKEKAGFPCPAEMRTYIRKLALAHPPGQTVVYSCLNAILCAEIVEAVSGQPLDRFAAENIFRPLKMTDTGFNPPDALRPRCVPTTKTDYGKGDGGFLRGQVHDPLAAFQAGVSGNAGLFSTAGDLARLAQMMLSGGELDGARILSAETIADMTRVQNPGKLNAKGKPDRRGLLWDLYLPDPDGTGVETLSAYGHTGYTGTAIRIYPEQGVYIIALTNRVHPDDKNKVEQFRKQIWQTVGEVLMRVPPDAKAPSAP
jgi:CubicO group peptidase (beta-lactamase class C family)